MGCNIHDHMRAFIVVTDTAAIGQTNESGQVTLTIDPKYTEGGEARIELQVWHPRLPDNTRPVIREVDPGHPVARTS